MLEDRNEYTVLPTAGPNGRARQQAVAAAAAVPLADAPAPVKPPAPVATDPLAAVPEAAAPTPTPCAAAAPVVSPVPVALALLPLPPLAPSVSSSLEHARSRPATLALVANRNLSLLISPPSTMAPKRRCPSQLLYPILYPKEGPTEPSVRFPMKQACYPTPPRSTEQCRSSPETSG